MTRLLFSSAMRMWPLASSSALLGLLSWSGPSPVTPVCPYCQTIFLLSVTSMTRALPWSVIRTCELGNHVLCTGALSWSEPDPVTPGWPYRQMILALGSKSITRLSGQPFGHVGSAPAGTPVPATRVRFPTRCASLMPTTECGPGLLDPFPKDQTILWVLGFTSVRRLLFCSGMRMFSGVLKPFPWACVEMAQMAPSDAVQMHLFK